MERQTEIVQGFLIQRRKCLMQYVPIAGLVKINYEVFDLMCSDTGGNPRRRQTRRPSAS